MIAAGPDFASAYVATLAETWARNGGATLEELARLHRGVSIAVATSASAEACSGDFVDSCFEFVDAAVASALHVEAPGAEDDDAEILAAGLEAATLSLRLAAASDEGLRRFASAERLESSCRLLKHVATKVVAPLLPKGGDARRRGLFESKAARTVARLDEALGVVVGVLESGARLEDRSLDATRGAAVAALAIDAASPAVASLQFAALGTLSALNVRAPSQRPSVVDDLLHLIVAPRSKKQLRSFKVVDAQHYALSDAPSAAAIRLSSALAMLLVQETGPAAAAADGGDDDGDNDEALSFSDGVVDSAAARLLGAARKVAQYVAQAVVAQCASSHAQCAEWRAQTLLLIDDVANSLFVPDWPAAETLLRALGDKLSADLRLSRDAPGPEPSSFVLFAVDAISAICSPLLRLRRAAAADDEWRRATDEEASSAALLEERVALQQLMLNGVMDRAKTEPWMASARRYHVALHLEALPTEAPRDLRAHVRAQWRAGGGNAAPSADNALSSSSSSSSGGALSNKGAWRKAPEWEAVLRAGDAALVARRVAARTVLVAAWPETLVAQLAAPLGHESAHVRAKCVKALDVVLQADGGSLMANPNVAHALVSRLHDEAILVRQCAVDCIGNHALRSDVGATTTYATYHAALLERLGDTGVSVRKAVVKILKQSLEIDAAAAEAANDPLNNKTARAAATLARLIQRASHPMEEPTVKALVRDAVRDAWLSASIQIGRRRNNKSPPPSSDEEERSAPSSPKAACHHDDGADVPESPTKKARVVQGEDDLAPSTRQMVDVVASERGAAWVAEVLKGALRDDGDDAENNNSNNNDDDDNEDSGKRVVVSAAKQRKLAAQRETAHDRAVEHAAALVEHLLRLDESRHGGPQTTEDLLVVGTTAEGGSTPQSSKSRRKLSGPSSADVVATCRALRALAEAKPAVVAKQVHALAPYLRADNGLASAADEAAVCCAVADVLANAVQALPVVDAKRLCGDVSGTLTSLIHRFGSKVVEAALRCLGAFHARGCDGAKAALDKVTLAYFDALKRCVRTAAKPTQGEAATAARCCVVLGLVCRHLEVAAAPPPPHAAALKAPHGGFLDPLVGGQRGGDGGALALYAALSALFRKTPDASPARPRCAVALCWLFGACGRVVAAAQGDGTVNLLLWAQADTLRAAALCAWTEALDAAAGRSIESAARGAVAEILKGEGDDAAETEQEDAASALSGATQGQVAKLVKSLFLMRGGGTGDGASSPSVVEKQQRGGAGAVEARRATLGFVGAVLRHGLCNPRDIIPHVYASCCDGEAAIRRDASRLLEAELARHGEYVRTQFVQGVATVAIHRAAAAAAAASNKKDHGAALLLDDDVCFAALADAYALAVRPSKSHRHATLRGLVDLAHKRSGPSSLLAKKVAGANTNGGHKGGGGGDDDAAVAQWLQATEFVARVLALLPYATQDEPLFVIHAVSKLGSIDAHAILDRVHKARAAAEDTGGGGAGVVDQVARDAAAARALTTLLRLKRGLKCAYRLKDTRCKSYSASDAAAKDKALAAPDDPTALRLALKAPLALPLGPAALDDVFDDLEALVDSDENDFTLSAAKSPRTKAPRSKATVPDRPAKGTTPRRATPRRATNTTLNYDDAAADDDVNDEPFFPAAAAKKKTPTRKRTKSSSSSS